MEFSSEEASYNASHTNDSEKEKELDISQLPKAKVSWKEAALYQYQGSWYPGYLLPNVIRFQNHFQAHDQDIILASHPKTGTTWLKALLFSIVTRSNTPLLTSNPHTLIPLFEFTLFANAESPDLTSGVSSRPRLSSTHIPFNSIPDSIKRSKCRIVYISRNPLDVLVSLWHFANARMTRSSSDCTIESYVEKFCEGETPFGPFWDHVLGYWKESLENPERVLFLKYEDVKKDTVSQMKRIAEFVGFPFTEEEESGGVIAQISEFCSLNNMREFEVNKRGKFMQRIENKTYFRKGEVGDWVNHLSPSMVKHVKEVTEEKLCGSGLTFQFML